MNDETEKVVVVLFNVLYTWILIMFNFLRSLITVTCTLVTDSSYIWDYSTSRSHCDPRGSKG
jgi:hypothetical protein